MMILSSRHNVAATFSIICLSLIGSNDNKKGVVSASTRASPSQHHHLRHDHHLEERQRQLDHGATVDATNNDVFCLSDSRSKSTRSSKSRNRSSSGSSSSRSSSSASSSGEASSKLFDKMFVFGDSLSDTGNAIQFTPCIPGTLPIFCGDNDGRASDGDVIPEYLMRYLTTQTSLDPAIVSSDGQTPTSFVPGATNFAISGATAGVYNPSRPNLQTQVDLYILAKQTQAIEPTANDLHYISIGANDSTNALEAAFLLGSDGVAQVIETAVTAVFEQISRLIDEGQVCNIMVLNSFDAGKTPQANALGSDAIATYTLFVDSFNQGLADLTFPKDYCGNNIKLIDANEMEKELRADPNVPIQDIERSCNNKFTGPCDASNFNFCLPGSFPTIVGGQCYCPLPIFPPTRTDCGNDYAFYDEIHPTTAFSGLFASKVIESLVCDDESSNE